MFHVNDGDATEPSGLPWGVRDTHAPVHGVLGERGVLKDRGGLLRQPASACSLLIPRPSAKTIRQSARWEARTTRRRHPSWIPRTAARSGANGSSTRILGKVMRDALVLRKGGNLRRTPTQDPTLEGGRGDHMGGASVHESWDRGDQGTNCTPKLAAFAGRHRRVCVICTWILRDLPLF